MGDNDEYPSWALPLVYRRMLWQEYGIAVQDFSFEDMMLAIRLRALEAERQNYISKSS
jgi:hypothetical protein